MLSHSKPKFKILLIGFGLFFLPFLSHAQVSSIVFTTDPQTVKTNELSGPITIQTQDSAGNFYKTPETIDLEFISTSATGQFLGTTGNAITKTMNTNTYNKNFAYKDSTEGNYILTVNATGRNSRQTWSANQTIVISNTISASTTTPTATTTEETTNANQNSSNNTITQTTDTSVHYSSIPLSKVIPEIAYKVGAGRARLGCVGEPIEFRGESNADFNGFTNYKWSFGDGAIGYGHIVSHSYAYPGDYVVVLNAVSPAGQAISRTEVKIISEDFVISDASPRRIEIENDSKYEINLFGRAIQSEGNIFVFPEDTIIKVGQQISFPDSVTGLHPFNNNDVLMIVVGDSLNKSFVPAVQIAENKSFDQKQIEVLRSKAVEIQKELVLISNNTDNLASPIVALDSSSSVVADPTSTPSKLTHRSFFERLKLFFFGK